MSATLFGKCKVTGVAHCAASLARLLAVFTRSAVDTATLLWSSGPSTPPLTADGRRPPAKLRRRRPPGRRTHDMAETLIRTMRWRVGAGRGAGDVRGEGDDGTPCDGDGCYRVCVLALVIDLRRGSVSNDSCVMFLLGEFFSESTFASRHMPRMT